jgi:hypothetical protein
MAIYNTKIGNNGHLGNQMFQYASLRGIADKNKLEWKVPPPQQFGSKYQLRSNIFSLFKLSFLLENNVETGQPSKTYVEKSMNFDESLFTSIKDDTDLDGYFQSWRYFDHMKDQILSDFTFKNSIDVLDKPLDCISLHVRRTDYVGIEDYLKNIFPQYYKDALEYFADERVMIFSDDIEWCKQQEVFSGSRFIFQSGTFQEDFYLLSRCKSSIIANSTFSWWAAYLNKNPDKTIIAPKQWFGPVHSNHNMNDLILPDWICL